MRFAISLTALAVLAACGGKKSDEVDGKAKPKAVEPKDKTDIPPKPAVDPVALKPMIHALGTDRSVPTSIVVELAQPVMDLDQIGGDAGGSKLKITPEIAGSFAYTSPSELVFTPAQPFELATEYKVELLALETRDGVLERPAGETWSYTFKTPAFEFLGWAPTDTDFAHQTVTMELRFSTAVLPTQVVAATTITIDGAKPAGIQMLPTTVPNVVPIVIHDPKIAPGHKLAMAFGKLSSLAGGSITGKADYVISQEKAVSIKTATAVEGAGGFYVEVVCNDAAAPPGNRGYYDRGTYQHLSQRCQLGEKAMSQIHFDPPVAKAYITPGRAGFRIFGEFKRGAYGMKIDAGALSVDGGLVLAPFSQSFAISARKPALQFAGTGRYLPRTAWNNLGIKHLNVEQANLVVRRIPPENLIFYLGGNDNADARTSDLILDKTIAVRGKADEQGTTWLDVASLIPAGQTRGVLEMKLVAIGARTTARLLLTNMSLVAKKTSVPGKPWLQTVKVWALDMDTADALTGVDVSLVRNSGKSVARCETRGADGCTLEVKTDDDPDQTPPFALIAKKGDDLTYLRYQDLRADVADSSTAGVPYSAESPYHTALYADRGVYRPGDTAHVVAIVRDAKDKAPDAGLPVDVRVYDPKAKVVRKLVIKTNASGVVALDQVFPNFADTGHWRAELAVADRPLGSYDLQVEEFVPERMKVDATATKSDVLTGEKIGFDVSARYLFGGSAADSGVQLECQLHPATFEPKDNGDFIYGIAPRGKRIDMAEARDQLDLKGQVAIACGDSPTGGLRGTATAEATIHVLEAGSGRATVGHASVTVHPEKYYIGMRTKAQRATTGEAFVVEGRIVDWQGKVVPNALKKLQLQFLHYESDYGYQASGNDDEETRYDRSVRPVPEGKREVDVKDGAFELEVKPGEAAAGYVVRAVSGGAKTDLVLDGDYSYEYDDYGENGYGDQSPRPQRPTQLKLSAPKEIAVGTAMELKVKTPYHGKLLWTVETDHVIKSEWIDATGAEASWKFTLDAFAPTVYVSAFLVKDPHLESKDAFLPDRAYGLQAVRVTPVEFTQEVRIEVPKEVRSQSPLTVAIDVGANMAGTVATVAVIDEGILQLTNFPTPDPLKQLFAKRALGVETYETLGWTMLHQGGKGTNASGGGGDDMAGEAESGAALKKDRVQPTKPVALFSGVVPIGADGKATVPFQVPMYRGKLRVMVVTANATRVGRAEASVIVRDPLVVQTTFPRFVTQKDQLQIPVFLTNVSGGPLEVDVAIASETIAIPGVVLKGGDAMTFSKPTAHVKLDDGHSETVVFAVTAAMANGGAKLKVNAKATGPKGTFNVADEVSVPFLPAGPKERTIQKFKVAAGAFDLKAKLGGWVPLSEESQFWLTNNPYADAFAHLPYLVHYPYGCIEQTASSTRPLLYASALVQEVDPRFETMKIEDMVVAGVARILSMETPSGGFGYWPGATQPLEWATAYATHVLLDAKKAGFAVPEDRLKEVLAWIEGRVAAYERGERVAHEPWNHYDSQSEAYLHYVLAMAGKGKKARMLQLVSEIKPGSLGELAEDRYMLEAGLYLAGDRRFEKDLKAPDTTPIANERINSWSFYSDRRKRGFELDTFFDLFGAKPEGELLAQRVAEGLSGSYSGYYNTQELVWGMSGLGKWVTSVMGKGTAGGTVTADGTVLKARSRGKTNSLTWNVVRASEYGKLALDVPDSAAGMWLVVTSDGVRASADYKVGGNGLSVSRVYHTNDGTVIDPNKDALHLGDLLTVEIDVANTSGVAIQNLALVDRLPAAFEIENARLGRGAPPVWVKADELWQPDFQNLRDDHLEAFGTLYPNQPRKLIYSVRVVTAGTFTIPPVDVEAMYDASLWARAPAGKATVEGPWTGKTL